MRPVAPAHLGFTQMASDRRCLRLGESLREEIVFLLMREVKDPRIGMVTITHVQVADDFSRARVLFRCMGDREAQERCLQGLRSAGGFLRSKLGQRLRLRRIPVLDFRLDPTWDLSTNLTSEDAPWPRKHDAD